MNKKWEKEFKQMIASAEKFRDKDGYYVFPFEVLDKTPGGKNLGRIEWHMELIPSKKGRTKYEKGRYKVEFLYVWASQTRDERYAKKIFKIPCWAEGMTADVLHERSSYFHYVWRTMICEAHKNIVFSAYPANQHKALKIDVGSSISITATFI